MMDIDNCTYVALHLGKPSQEYLRKMADAIDAKFGYYHSRILCHHMTIVFKPQKGTEIYNWCRNFIGKEYSARIIKYGVSDKANAVMLETICPSANKIKHVTLSVHPAFRGKPADSNKITDWYDWPANIPNTIKGTVECFR